MFKCTHELLFEKSPSVCWAWSPLRHPHSASPRVIHHQACQPCLQKHVLCLSSAASAISPRAFVASVPTILLGPSSGCCHMVARVICFQTLHLKCKSGHVMSLLETLQAVSHHLLGKICLLHFSTGSGHLPPTYPLFPPLCTPCLGGSTCLDLDQAEHLLASEPLQRHFLYLIHSFLLFRLGRGLLWGSA